MLKRLRSSEQYQKITITELEKKVQNKTQIEMDRKEFQTLKQRLTDMEYENKIVMQKKKIIFDYNSNKYSGKLQQCVH